MVNRGTRNVKNREVGDLHSPYHAPPSKAYRDNYDAIFRKAQDPAQVVTDALMRDDKLPEHPCPCEHYWYAERWVNCKVGCDALAAYKDAIGYVDKKGVDFA